MIPDIRRVGQHATLYATARNEQIIDFIIDQLGEGWQYNIESYGGIHRFVFKGPKGELTANAHLIASVAEDPPTLLWRWSGQAQEGNTAGLNVSNAAEAMRKWGLQQDLPGFVNQEVPYQPGEDAVTSVAGDVGDAAFEIFGPLTVFLYVPINQSGTFATFLLDGFSIPIPEMTIEEIFVKWDRILSHCDDPAWSIEGISHMRPDWRVEEVEPEEYQRAWKTVDEKGRYFVAEITVNRGERYMSFSKKGLFTEEGT